MSEPGGSGDVAVITGAAGGIGFALARAYIERGLTVVIADLDADRLADAARLLEAAGGDVREHPVDLTDELAVGDLATFATSIGTVRSVCCNAGIMSSGTSTWATPGRTFDTVVGVNLRGLFNSIHAFVPALVAQGTPASLVITASMAGMVASPYAGVYAASKAGAVALAKAVRDELAAEAPAVTVTLLAPGMVATDLIKSSVAALTGEAAMDAAMAEVAHDALNEAGVPPAEAATWAIEAADEGRFWALPPRGDVFTELLRGELADLQATLGQMTEAEEPEGERIA